MGIIPEICAVEPQKSIPTSGVGDDSLVSNPALSNEVVIKLQDFEINNITPSKMNDQRVVNKTAQVEY